MREKSFEEIVGEIRALKTRNEIQVDEVPAPQKLAPFSIALTAEVANDSDDEVATGRFVLLHDPKGQDGWSGRFRCVTFVRADIDMDMVSDPLLADVGWTWLMESLDKLGCSYTAPSGTVTRISSSSFGSLAERDEESELEVRASWTPLDGNSIAHHVQAWLELLEMAAGLAPIPEGVTQLGRGSTSSAGN